jgi:hypothetical protein
MPAGVHLDVQLQRCWVDSSMNKSSRKTHPNPRRCAAAALQVWLHCSSMWQQQPQDPARCAGSCSRFDMTFGCSMDRG